MVNTRTPSGLISPAVSGLELLQAEEFRWNENPPDSGWSSLGVDPDEGLRLQVVWRESKFGEAFGYVL